MDVKIIKSAEDYEAAMTRLSALMSLDPQPNSKEENELELRFYADKAGVSTIKINDTNGRTLLSKKTNVVAGLNTVSYALNLAPGVYVGLVNTEGKVAVAKFQK